jgi:hypothetical protein
MPDKRIAVYLETSDKKVFACAQDWPGWCRAGKDEELALAALADAARRYAKVAKRAKVDFPDDDAATDFEVVERIPGGAGTAFGVPGESSKADRAPVDAAEAKRLALLVGAAWATFDQTRAASPEQLRKGPRGGGRDRDKMAAHVMDADSAYAQQLGLKHRPPAIDDPKAIKAMRDDMLRLLGEPSDGEPLAGRRWLHRYAARRIAWHALDHAWEMEDRAEPA